MVTVVTAAVSPDWTSATTAIGTVAVAVVAVGVALFVEWRTGLRLREEHKRSDDLLDEERALHAKPRSTDAFSVLSVFQQVSALIGAIEDCTW